MEMGSLFLGLSIFLYFLPAIIVPVEVTGKKPRSPWSTYCRVGVIRLDRGFHLGLDCDVDPKLERGYRPSKKMYVGSIYELVRLSGHLRMPAMLSLRARKRNHQGYRDHHERRSPPQSARTR